MRKYEIWICLLIFTATAFSQIELYSNTSVIQYPTIQAAVDAANNGDTIVIGEGIYTGPGNCDIVVEGKAIIIRSADPNDPSCVANTIIDCQGSETQNHRGFSFYNFEDSNSIVTGLTIKNGYTYFGGSFYLSSHHIKINNCQIYDCCSSSEYTCDGGGIFVYNTNCSITGCDFRNNQTIGSGGAVAGLNSSVLIENSNFENNVANSGGAVYFYTNSTNCVLRNCLFQNNRAADVGAAEIINCEVDSCIFRNNKSIVGNIVCAVYSQLKNCLVYENTGQNAVRLFNSSMLNSTVAYNQACGVANSSNHEMKNCIVWGNNSQLQTYQNVNISQCCIQGWDEDDPNNISRAPIFVDTYNDDYRLMEYSPCIDAGDNSPVDMQTDLNGNPRIIDGDRDGIDTVDIGAYEFVPVEPNIADIKVSTNKLQFRYFSDANAPDSQQFEILNSGSEDLNWQITSDANWVNFTPTDGTSANDSNTPVTVTIDTNQLTKNDHIARLTIADANNTVEPAEVRIYIYGFYGQGGQLIKIPQDYNNIQAAVDASSDGDTIVLADGIYTGTGNTDVNIIDLEITIASRNGPDNCIIDCNGYAENGCGGFYLAGTDSNTVVLSGLNIINNHIYAAIKADISNPIIMDCNLYIENDYPGFGSGIYNTTADNKTIVANCQISGFSNCALAAIQGQILDCTITDNVRAISNTSYANQPGLIQGCNIFNNYKEEDSTYPSISYFYGDIIDCKFSGNYGILSNCQATLKNCTITDNDGGGRGNLCSYYNGDLINCKISNNGNEWDSLATLISNTNQDIINITNCEISGNYFSRAPLRNIKASITNSKVVNNTCTDSVGALEFCDVNLVECTIAGNYGCYHDTSTISECSGYISNCQIIGNYGSEYNPRNSAAVYNFDGDIEDSNISGNHCSGVSGANIVRRCIFANNLGIGVRASSIADSIAYKNSSLGIGDTRGEIHVTNCQAIGNCDGGISASNITNCIVKNNTASYDNYGGIYCFTGDVDNCIVQNNSGNEVGGIKAYNANVINCLVTGNKGNYCGGIDAENSEIVNCTIVGNSSRDEASGIKIDGYDIINCIVWDNKTWQEEGDTNQIYPESAYAEYSCIQGGWPQSRYGIIDVNPLFVDPGHFDDNGTPEDQSDDIWIQGDYHLQSVVGRYDEATQTWQQDPYSSFCIDTGCNEYPSDYSDYSPEPWPNGERINMGFYGSTAFASKSGNSPAACADVNEDKTIDFLDLAILANHWLKENSLPQDPDTNGTIDLTDIQVLANNWLETIY